MLRDLKSQTLIVSRFSEKNISKIKRKVYIIVSIIQTVWRRRFRIGNPAHSIKGGNWKSD